MIRTTVCSVLLSLASLAPTMAEPEIVARVGDREISRHQLEASVVQRLNQLYIHRQPAGDKRLHFEREQLQVLIRLELNVLAARDLDWQLPKEKAEEQRASIEAKLGKQAYKEALHRSGMTTRAHRRLLSEHLGAVEIFEHEVKAAVGVSDAEVRSTYESSPERWLMPESARVFHILLQVEEGGGEQAWADRETQGSSILARLEAGESFAAIASEESGDDYRVKGGDLGWVHRGRLMPEVEDAVWSVELGVPFGPIKSGAGYHLIVVSDRHEARPFPFEDVESRIREQMLSDRLEKKEQEWYRARRELHVVEILDPALREDT